MITALLLACSPLAAQLPIDATLDTSAIQPPATKNFNSSRASSAFDDFNRANSTNMGADWTESGDIEIYNNMGRGVSSLSYMNHTSAAAPYATSTYSSRFDTTGGLVYVAMMAGFANGSDNVFVKVQDNNSDGWYDRVFFYYGNNGGPWAGYTGSYYYDLATPTVSGTMTLSFDNAGDDAVLTINNDASGATEVFVCGGLAVNSGYLGDGAGVGTYGQCLFDDWSFNGGGGGFALSTTGAPGGTMTFDCSGATPGGPVAYCYAFGLGSYSGVNPYTGNTVTTGLSSFRFNVAFIGGADGSGNISHSANVPAGAAGVVHVQCVDLLSDATSNVVSL